MTSDECRLNGRETPQQLQDFAAQNPIQQSQAKQLLPSHLLRHYIFSSSLPRRHAPA